MFGQVLNLVANMISQVFALSFRVLDSLGGTEFIFGAFSVLTIYRFLLSPLFGRSGVNRIDIGRSESRPETDKEFIDRYIDNEFEKGSRLEVN